MFSTLILFRRLLFFIISLFCLEFEVLMLFASIDTFILILLYFILFLILWNPPKAQMFQCRGQLLLVNLLGHRCYGAEVIYFVFSSDMENRTLSQIFGRLYLPIFLLRVGLLTLMYIAYFMALVIFWPSLLIILKCCTVVVRPVIFWCSKIGNDAFKCSLYISSKVLDDCPMYSLSYSFSFANLKNIRKIE